MWLQLYCGSNVPSRYRTIIVHIALQPCTSYFSSRRQCEIVAKLMEDNNLFSAESAKMPNALGKISGTAFQNR